MFNPLCTRALFTSVLAISLAACAAPPPRTGSLGFEEFRPPAMADATGAPSALDAADARAAVTPPVARGEQGGDGSWRGGFSGLIGYRVLDNEDVWSDPTTNIALDEQIAFGLEFDLRPPEFPLGFELGSGFSFMADSVDIGGVSVDFTGSVFELYAGPRLTLDLGDSGVHPYVGGGITWLLATISASASSGGVTASASQDENSVAGYVHGGVLFDLGESFRLGGDIRLVTGSDLGQGADADYVQGALVIGSFW